MAFQFLCPQGHTLQADESQIDQQCQCPHCGVEFVVPPPAGFPAAGQPQWTGSDVPAFDEPTSPTETSEQNVLEFGPRIGPRFDVSPGPAAAWSAPEPAAAFLPQSAAQVELLHIRCPSGHILETPRDMLDEDAMCPFCQAQFRLRYRDSIEFKKEKEADLARREAHLGQVWLHWAVAIAAVVIIGLIVLIVASVAR
jgi:rubredoxin